MDEAPNVAAGGAVSQRKLDLFHRQAGPDGVEYLAFGAGEDASEVEMVQGWWSD